ncbi:DNA-binding response regulator, OmpR family, contains REC and winged-helix (wHTH) domain [Saccharopolyspora antimicrobica]|uniref:DNA-binding response OmpR family regulator n=2 Tax=Saccharopolyspora TaxID=1835 RepID=A0A1I4QSC9_9PSEU|nr:DNA-binding response OmpR family regulator [Saccharopolyspora antimicrobica]SEG09348.1 DNA-binding response regulator, OmpR family, contains REC and winged-helix (wHTH) domain [Saccharopolyspora kobensis]SFE44728.1 DNA-binding response regulator, OmpR family, contains REC and winged-helix (wHTH) domain [Saccharopolyspora kobensis]SFM42974.1 DNA-binding response regulator, OmpR family, contains REC and winged-helix (wHTH) domain [Saccharopolyspora antimicrobica]
MRRVSAHVLVAEDDPKQAELIRRYLERDGHQVVVVGDGRAAIDEARRRLPDLVVLDVMMPKVDGLDVCRVLRAESDVPIVLLTARTTEDDVLLGLDLGADDYITKPYSPRQLAARVRAILRRVRRVQDRGHQPLRVGDLVVDQQRHEVLLAGAELDCTPAEFRMLAVLAAEPGRAFTRGQLLSQAFGMDKFITERTVDVHVMNLRRKLEPDPRRPVRLLTVYGVGYKLQDCPDGTPA